MIRHLLAAAIVLAPVSAFAASNLTYKGGYESSITGQTGSECNVATAAYCTAGTAFDNSSTKYIYATVVFTPGSAWTPTGGPISCWLLESVDGGSTYEVTPANNTARQPDFSLVVMSGTSVTAKAAAFGIMLKPGYQKVVCYNNTGATIPNSSTVTIYPWQIQQ